MCTDARTHVWTSAQTLVSFPPHRACCQVEREDTVELYMWLNVNFTSRMCSQTCTNYVMLSCHYGPKPLRNVFNILLNLCKWKRQKRFSCFMSPRLKQKRTVIPDSSSSSWGQWLPELSGWPPFASFEPTPAVASIQHKHTHANSSYTT